MATYEILVVANADQAEAAMASLAAKIGVAGSSAPAAEQKIVSLTDRLKGMGPVGSSAAAGIENLATGLSGKLGVAGVGTSEVIQGLNSSLGGMGTAGLVAGGAVAAYAAAMLIGVEVAKKSIDAFMSEADAVRTLSAVTGMSAQQASILNGAAGLLGVSSDALTRSFGTLNQQIEKGTLAKYGIEVAHAKDGSVDFNATLENLAQHFATDTNKTQANAEAKTLLGRTYRDLLPLLTQGADGLKRLEDIAAGHVAILTPEDIKAAEDFKIQVASLKDEVNKLWVEIGQQLIPTVSQLVGGLVTAGGVIDNFVSHNHWLITGMIDLYSALNPVVEVLKTLGRGSGDTAVAQAAVAQAALASATAFASEQAAADALTASQAALATDASTWANADISARQASLSLQDVQIQWSQKVAAAGQAQADALTKANSDIALSQQGLRDAEIKSAEDIAAAKHSILQAQQQLRADSQLDLQSARTVEDAKTKLARIEADIASGKLSGVDATRQLADAELALSRDQADQASKAKTQAQKVVDDKYNIQLAQQHLSDVERTTTEAIAAAKQKLTDAMLALTKAQDMQGISSMDLAKHQLDLESATLRNYDAQQKLRTEADKLRAALVDSGLSASSLNTIFKTMGLLTFPDMRAQIRGAVGDLQALSAAQSAAASAPAPGPWAPGHAPTTSPIFGTALSNTPGGITVTVNAGGLIFDPTSANTVGVLVANGVLSELRRQAARGVTLFPLR